MSDKSGAPRPSRAGGVILGSLAVGAILGVPAAAGAACPDATCPAAAIASVEATEVDVNQVGDGESGDPATASGAEWVAFGDQFQKSFTPGAVAAGERGHMTIICET